MVVFFCSHGFHVRLELLFPEKKRAEQRQAEQTRWATHRIVYSFPLCFPSAFSTSSGSGGVQHGSFYLLNPCICGLGRSKCFFVFGQSSDCQASHRQSNLYSSCQRSRYPTKQVPFFVGQSCDLSGLSQSEQALLASVFLLPAVQASDLRRRQILLTSELDLAVVGQRDMSDPRTQ